MYVSILLVSLLSSVQLLRVNHHQQTIPSTQQAFIEGLTELLKNNQNPLSPPELEQAISNLRLGAVKLARRLDYDSISNQPTCNSATQYLAVADAQKAFISNLTALDPVLDNPINPSPLSSSVNTIAETPPMSPLLDKTSQLPTPITEVLRPNLNNQSWTYGSSLDPTKLNDIYLTAPNQIFNYCPLQTPFTDGTQCFACPKLTPYFDLSQKICVQCTQSDNHSCQSYRSNVQAVPNRIVVVTPHTLTQYTTVKDIACPTDKPFFNGSQCIDCPAYFDIAAKTCMTCPNYDPTTHTCQTAYRTRVQPGSGLILPATVDDYLKTQNTTLLQCPSSTPFWSGAKCINCPTGNYFNVQTAVCTSCPIGTHYDSKTYKCATARLYTAINGTKWGVNTLTVDQVTAQYTANLKDYAAKACPMETPFFDGTKCIQCQANQYFLMDTKMCTKCATGESFDRNVNKCIKLGSIQYHTNPQVATNLINDGKSKQEIVSNYYQQFNDNPNLQDCPTATPYFDGISCISCPALKPYFNIGYRRCQMCDVGTHYDSTVSECMSEANGIVLQEPNLEKMMAGIFA